MKFLSGFIAFFFIEPILAASEFQATPNCATAEVVSGDTCSNAKIQFDFKKCDSASEPKIVERVSCEGVTIVGRVTVNEHRFEAKFKKKDDGWGSVSWTQVEEVKAWKKRPSTQVEATKPTAASQPASAQGAAQPKLDSVRTPAQAQPPIAFKFSGFFDLRLTQYHSEAASIVDQEKSGFLFEDGAVQATASMERLEAFIDIPFGRNADASGDSSDWAWGNKKGQLLARYALMENLKLTMGQFDTFFGLEVNDSRDRVFGNTGLVYSILPVVHTGAYFEYSQSGWTVRLMAANPLDRETLGTNPGAYYEYAATVGFANDRVHAQLGHLIRPMKDLNSKASHRNFTDLLVGLNIGQITLDAEYALLDDPRKNSLTASATDGEDAGTALALMMTFSPFDYLKFSIRNEMIEKDPGATTGAANYSNAKTWAGQIQYKVQNEFWTRVEYNEIQSGHKLATDGEDEQRWDLGFIFSI